MSLGFYLLALGFAFFLGYALSSEGFFSSSNVGQVALLIMGIISLGLIGWAIWIGTWLAGLLAIVVIVVGVVFGRMITQSLLGMKYR